MPGGCGLPCGSHLCDDFEQRLQTLLARIGLTLGIAPVSFQRERALVAVLQHGANLAEVIELAVADFGPYYLSVLMLVVAQVYVEDPCRIELSIAVGKTLLTAFAGVVGIPGEADIVLLDVLEQHRGLGAGRDIAAAD